MPEEIAVLAFTSIIVGGVVLSMAIQAVARYYQRKVDREASGAVGAVEALRDEVGALRSSVETLRGEVSEMHDRLDFTERMLAQQRDPSRPRLGGVAE